MLLRPHFWAVLLAAVVGVIVMLPQWRLIHDVRYQGVPISVNSDEISYETHLQEALLGRFGDAGKGITAQSAERPSFHLSPIEEVYGLLFGWTGMSAAQVYRLMDFAMPALLALALYALLLSYGFSRWESLAGAALFCALQLANLNRPINQRASFLFLVLVLLSIQHLRTRTAWAVVAGLLTGLLLGTYIWWWMVASLLLALHLLIAFLQREQPTLKRFLIAAAVAALASAPFAWHMVAIRAHPAYADAALRAGLIHWWLPESLPWSILFLLMAIGVLLLWLRNRDRTLLPIVTLTWAALITFNQQLIHGQLLMFRAHLLFFLTLAAVAVFLLCLRHARSSLAAIVALVATLGIFTALLSEDRAVLAQWRIDDSDYSEQHLAGALAFLDTLPRATVLSDPATSGIIAAITHHDVVFTNYLQHELFSNQELAKRFCLTQLPVPPGQRNLEDTKIIALANAIWSERDPAKQQELRNEDLRLAHAACDGIDQAPVEALGEMGVTYVLWNEKDHPEWDLSRLRTDLQAVDGGDGWSVWQ